MSSYIIIPEHVYKYNSNDMTLYQAIGESIGIEHSPILVLPETALARIAEICVEADFIIFANALCYDLTRREYETKLCQMKGVKIYVGFDDEYKLTQTLYFAQFMDFIFTLDLASHAYFKQIGISSKLIMLPLQSKLKRASDNYIHKQYDVSFVGSVDRNKPDRYKMLMDIKDRYPNSYFPGMHGVSISNDDMMRTFQESRININLSGISAYEYGLDIPLNRFRRGMKARPFEVGMAGGFCLSEYSPSLENILKAGVHIDYFNSSDQLFEKLDYYLSNPEKRYEISENLSHLVARDISSASRSNIFIRAIRECNVKGRARNLREPGKLYINSVNEAFRYLFQVKRLLIRKSFVTLLDLIRSDVSVFCIIIKQVRRKIHW